MCCEDPFPDDPIYSHPILPINPDVEVIKPEEQVQNPEPPPIHFDHRVSRWARPKPQPQRGKQHGYT